MLEIAIYLRAIQLVGHNAHHFCARVVFHQDHEFFAEIYKLAESGYDSVIERMIGLGKESEMDMGGLMKSVSTLVESVPAQASENKDYYIQLKKMLESCLSMIEKQCASGLSQGTLQMLGGLADQIEILLYKINRRLKG